MTDALYLVGCGGHGRVVLDSLLTVGCQVSGILDSQLMIGQRVFDIEVVGDDAFVGGLDPARTALVNGIGANPYIKRRRIVFENLRKKNFRFHNLIHPSSILGRNVDLGEGCQLMAGVIVQSGVTVGANCVVNTGAQIDHDCHIGSHAFISPGAILCGGVQVGESVFIGAGAIILPGISVERNAIIGAGAVVRKAVSAGWILAGNPTTKIGTIDE